MCAPSCPISHHQHFRFARIFFFSSRLARQRRFAEHTASRSDVHRVSAHLPVRARPPPPPRPPPLQSQRERKKKMPASKTRQTKWNERSTNKPNEDENEKEKAAAALDEKESRRYFSLAALLSLLFISSSGSSGGSGGSNIQCDRLKLKREIIDRLYERAGECVCERVCKNGEGAATRWKKGGRKNPGAERKEKIEHARRRRTRMDSRASLSKRILFSLVPKEALQIMPCPRYATSYNVQN